MTGKEEETKMVTTDELLKLIDTIAADGWDAKGMAAIRARIEQHDGLVEALKAFKRFPFADLEARDMGNAAFRDDWARLTKRADAALARAGAGGGT